MIMINNPILEGFCPDPSIVRVGNDYYIAVSTFEWWPGVKIFHSKDLQNWTQLGAALTRTSQLNMLGDPMSGGVWAPCLSYDNGRFYLLFTDVKTKKGRFYNTHNYLVWTDDIQGEWAEPVYLNSVGFDPSLFHDTDGRKYLINMVNGFKGVLVQELDPKTWKLIGEQKKVYDGSGIGCTEGPHMYHIGEWYYLLTAEGGTGYEHCVTIARSKSIWGPFETDPENPLLTSDKEHKEMLQKCGHGDLVQTQDGEWYIAHLCARPQTSENHCVLGRETALQKLVLNDDGWFRLKCGGKYAQNETESPKGILEESGREKEALDKFSDVKKWDRLQGGFSSPRRPLGNDASLSKQPGYLHLIGRESLNSLHRVTLAAKRQTQFCTEASTKMKFNPTYEEQLAGLVYFYDAMNFYVFGKTVDEEKNSILVLLKSNAGVITDEIDPIMLASDEEIILRAETDQKGESVTFSYCLDGRWSTAKADCTTEILTDEHCRGFTGAHFGMYVHDMTGRALAADFAWFYLGAKSSLK